MCPNYHTSIHAWPAGYARTTSHQRVGDVGCVMARRDLTTTAAPIQRLSATQQQLSQTRILPQLPLTAMASSAAANPLRRVALVTGASKGIGLEIARKLGAVDGLITVLGCQDVAKGEAAATALRAAGCSDIIVQRIELEDAASIASAREYVQREFGALDILVNNAAICFNDPTLYGTVPHTPFEQQAAVTMRVNFTGTLAVIRQFLPLLRASASPRLITYGSSAGRLSILRSPEKTALFTSPLLSTSQLEEQMSMFVADVEAGVHSQRGWPNTCYGMSKLGLIALTRVLARDEPQIAVNSCDPGYCATDQNNHQGTRPAERGAVTALMLALRSAGECVSGKHFFDEAEVDWLRT